MAETRVRIPVAVLCYAPSLTGRFAFSGGRFQRKQSSPARFPPRRNFSVRRGRLDGVSRYVADTRPTPRRSAALRLIAFPAAVVQEVSDHVHHDFARVRKIARRPRRATDPIRPGRNQRGRKEDQPFLADKHFGVACLERQPRLLEVFGGKALDGVDTRHGIAVNVRTRRQVAASWHGQGVSKVTG
jgi:hypothetical protein